MTNEPVDQYLNTLFDELNGTGEAGRRVLAEAEDHLLTSVAELVATGVPEAEAQRIAVERFGDARAVAAGVTSDVATARWSLSQLAGAAWLLGSGAVIAIGLSGLVAWAVGAAVTEGSWGVWASNVQNRIGMGLVGLLALAAYRRAQRRAPRPSAAPGRVLVIVTAVACFIAATAMLPLFSLSIVFATGIVAVALLLNLATNAPVPSRA